MKESVLHQIIKENKLVQDNFLDAIGVEKSDNIVFNSEDQYPNGLWADFSILKGNELLAIVELKGSDIGANEYVRGTGQLFQYQHFIDLEMSLRSYIYKDTKCVFCFPSDLLEDLQYNIGLFSYPNGCIILEFNETTLTFRRITESDLKKFSGESRNKEVIALSPYYIRDNRLYEIYIALKYLSLLKLSGEKNANRKNVEDFLKQLNTPNNGNWRNVFISLSSLGLINDENIPTSLGLKFSGFEFDEFAYEIYEMFIVKYITIIINALVSLDSSNNKITMADIKKSVNSLYRNKEVLFITDSDNRYLSSWLNIMKDDYGCVNFEKNKSERKYEITYPIFKYNRDSIRKEIRHRCTEAYQYIEKFNKILKGKIEK